MSSINLLINQTTDGTGVASSIEAGTYMVFLDGTLDGATVTLNAELSGGGSAQIDGGALSSLNRVNVTLPECSMTATQSSSGAFTSLTCRLQLVEAARYSPGE